MLVSHARVPVFDDPNLVSAAGLAPVLDLADRAGLEVALTRLTVRSPNRAVKSRAVIAGMLAGADSIDDLDLLRSGGLSRLIGEVRAPSTLGTFLRSFTHGHVLQLAKTNRTLLAGLPSPFTAGDGLVLVDMDDTIRQVHGYRKQAAAFGYSGVRGLNALVVAASSDGEQPVLLESQLRRGNIRSGAHGHWHLSRALTTTRSLAPGRRVLVRGDAAFCQHVNITAASNAGAWWSFTIPQWKTVQAAIATIGDDAWTGISYPEAIYDETTDEWISDAEVAEIPFTAFVSRKKTEHVPCRLVVRRVKTKNDPGQPALFDTWRYHAFITNSDPTILDTVEADRRHRGHAVIEQVISELKQGPLTHLPSGKFTATRPGSRSRSSRTTSLTPPPEPPGWRQHGCRRCCARSSPCPPGSPPPGADSSSTYPNDGPGRPSGPRSGTPPRVPDPRQHDDQTAPTGQTRRPQRGRASHRAGPQPRPPRNPTTKPPKTVHPPNPVGGSRLSKERS